METNYIENLKTYFRNVVLNAVDAERDIYQLINDKDIGRLISMMQDNDREVDKAIREYNMQLHEIMDRPDKYVNWTDDDGTAHSDVYVTEKLPRNRAQYINEIELFFLLGKPVIWKIEDGDDEAFKLFTDFWADYRMDSRLRQAKRLAGAETESAIVFNIERNQDNEIVVTPFVAARSLGYTLRPMFDQYKRLMAFALGYNLVKSNGNRRCWDIYTNRLVCKSESGKIGWGTQQYPNVIGKIPLIYFQQQKAWDGGVPRMRREEFLDSKTGDTNNYFADPMAAATADVLQSMPRQQQVGKMIQLTGESSRFEYINPPSDSVTRQDEKKDLADSILFDTFTPDFSFEKMRGIGTLTGKAIKNALKLGYIKRDNRIEIYGDLVDRLKSVVISILKLQHPDKEAQLDDLRISFEFAEPFEEDKQEYWRTIATLYQSGVLSLEKAVELLALTDSPEEEIDMIRMEAMEKLEAQNEMQTEKAQEEGTEETQNTEDNGNNQDGNQA